MLPSSSAMTAMRPLASTATSSRSWKPAPPKCRSQSVVSPPPAPPAPPTLAPEPAPPSPPRAPYKPYDVKRVIEAVVDDGDFLELQPHYAENIVCGFARLGGHAVGVV